MSHTSKPIQALTATQTVIAE